MKAPRVVQPELLDELPPDEPLAVQSRRDLRWVNVWMRNAATASRLIRRLRPSGTLREIGDIGAGDGTFLLRILRRLGPGRVRGARVRLVDQQRLVSPETMAAFEELGVHPELIEADVFDWCEKASGDAHFNLLICNLFLHHFEDARLRRLLECMAARTRLFVACEPRRSGLALGASKLLWIIGCNRISRHDAVVSVRAGFSDGEISQLWPRDGWKIEERRAGLFSHCFAAARLEERDGR